jgi:hypothetical protein
MRAKGSRKRPEKWFEPYEKARADGDWRAPEALMDRIYGRPAQAASHRTSERLRQATLSRSGAC